MICLLVMTDGRKDCITRTIESASARLVGPITRRVIHDDSGDPHYQHWLAETFPEFEIIRTPARSGFGAAIESAWMYLRLTAESDECRFLFHLEDDFTFNHDLPLRTMATVLDDQPHLVQLALRRQPWNAEERAAGGIVEQHPDDYREVWGKIGGRQIPWLEHRRFFTTNPGLYRRSLTWRGWPLVEHSEGVFTHQLLEDPALRFGFFGARASGEWVTHIGDERVGTGY